MSYSAIDEEHSLEADVEKGLAWKDKDDLPKLWVFFTVGPALVCVTVAVMFGIGHWPKLREALIINTAQVLIYAGVLVPFVGLALKRLEVKLHDLKHETRKIPPTIKEMLKAMAKEPFIEALEEGQHLESFISSKVQKMEKGFEERGYKLEQEVISEVRAVPKEVKQLLLDTKEQLKSHIEQHLAPLSRAKK
mmetsp:Transcript_110053/g.201712  ORF Transcript_110053/g.201712 Transcript_110053/m.201712 type:complete len:192 (+) Transcript_110053:119-694(+)